MYTYVDLFCGAGGFSLGFDMAGFKNVFSLDFDEKACETYRYNFPSHNLICSDISLVSDSEFLELTRGSDVDVVVGGPPCQGFSLAGNIGRKFIDDPRNKLYKEFVRAVGVIKPKFFVMENVASLYNHRKGKTRIEIIEDFESLGYYVSCYVLNAVNFGVPQNRRRVFFFGSKINDTFTFNEPKIAQQKTVKDAIHDLPKLKSGESSNIPNHNAMNHSEQMLYKMSFVKDGGTRLDIPEDIRPKSGDARKYIRYDSLKPSVTVTGDMRKVFHYSQNRSLTVRELARLQSFPDSFVFKGTSISAQQQVGNAVPPLMAKSIASFIKECLDKVG